MAQMMIKSPASSGFITTAKHYGDNAANYYQTGGGSVIGDSPLDWDGLLSASGSGDTYNEMTLVFSVYPLELSDAGNWGLLGSENGQILIGHWDANGGIWIGARTWVGTIQTINTEGDGAGDWAGMTPYEWNSIMIAFETSGGNRNIKIISNGVKVYDGLFDDNDQDLNPHSWQGYTWGGRYDAYTGPPERGMESYAGFIWCDRTYLDPDIYYTDFFDDNFKPKDIGADGSGVTGSQPDTFAPDGDLSNNLGFVPEWDEVGTVPDAPISPTD
jgi:hypothetical protein